MKVVILPRAKKDLKKLPRLSQIIIITKLRGIDEHVANKQARLLRGMPDIYRLRVGDLRIVYKQEKKQIWVITIRHRQDIYQKLKRFLT